MRIIISPAKKMRIDTDTFDCSGQPLFIKDTEILLDYLKQLDYQEAKAIWKCNDKIAALNYERIQVMDLYSQLTPAILAYEGIQYQHMAPGIFEKEALAYLEEHLRILSGFYGILRPFDGVTPYRLEMQAKLGGVQLDSLYAFWGKKLAQQFLDESDCIINLASKEYSKCILNDLTDDTRVITCIFGQLDNNRVIEKGTEVKIARGEMVRFMAENQIVNAEDLKLFDRVNYVFDDDLSNEERYVFIKKKQS